MNTQGASSQPQINFITKHVHRPHELNTNSGWFGAVTSELAMEAVSSTPRSCDSVRRGQGREAVRQSCAASILTTTFVSTTAKDSSQETKSQR